MSVLHPEALGERIDALGANGHAWMDGPTMLSLASASTTDQQMLGQAQALTTAAQQNVTATPLSSYSALDAAPTDPQTGLVNIVHSVVGAPRLSLNDLSGIQNSLLAGGYGHGLSTNGVWNSDWQAAYSQFSNDARNRYYQGEGQLLTERTKSVLHGLLNGLSLGGGLGSLFGFVTSIPHDLRQIAADTTGVVEGTASLVGREVQGAFTGTDYSGHGQSSIFGSAEHDALTGSGFVEGKTTEGERRQFTDANGNWDWGRVAGHAVDDIGTALLFVPVAGEVAGAARVGVGLGREIAATSARDVLARGLTRSAPENAVRGPGFLYKNLVERDGAPGLLNRQALENVPLLNRVGPALIRYSDGWYRARTLLAQPYAMPAVQALGTGATRTIMLGLGARATGALSTTVGGDPNSGLNAAVQRTFDPYTLRYGLLKDLGLDNVLNDVGFLLHPPIPTKTGQGAASRMVGDHVDAAVSKVSDVVGHLDLLGAYQRAVGEATGTIPSHEELISHFGGDHALNEFLVRKWSQHAAAMAAEKAMVLDDTAPASVASAEGAHWVHERAGQIQGDPVAMAQAVTDMLGAPRNDLVARLYSEIVRSSMDLEHATGNGGAAFMRGNFALGRVLDTPEYRSQLITPEAHEMAAAERDLATEQQIGGVGPGQRTANPDAAYSAEFLKQANINQTRGSIGLARIGTKTKTDIGRHLDELQQRWDEDFGPRYEQARALHDKDALRVLDEQTHAWLSGIVADIPKWSGTDNRTLSGLLSAISGEKGFAQVRDLTNDRMNLLASDVYPAMNADPVVKRMFDEVAANGYKVVYGNGIGHAAETPVHYFDLGQALTRTKKVFGALGLDVDRISQSGQGAMAHMGAQQEIQRLLDRHALPSVDSDLYTPSTILGILQRGNENTPGTELPWGLRTAQAIAYPIHRRAIVRDLASEGLTRQVPGRFGRTREIAEPEDVAARFEAMRQAMASTLGLRDLGRRQAIDTLTNPDRVPWLLGKDGYVLPDGRVAGTITREDASKIYDAILKGFTHRPGYMLGWSHAEDIFRAGMGFFGSRLQQALPGPLESFATGLLRLPNAYYVAQSRLRFQLSPMFDLRRVAKTNVKFGAYDLPTTIDPVGDLLRLGGPEAVKSAHALLDKVWPEQALANRQWIDASDQILSQNSAYGLFNPRHYAAWAVHHMNAEGKSIREMRDTLDKAMTYGNRTALERTANTVFFPFSFDKTLYRAVGGYMLDHPSQSMILLRAFNAYDTWAQQHKDNPISYAWWQEHAPILNEAAKLNAFTHGIGPGELGGINAPVLNAFLPQKYPPSKASHSLVNRFIPAVNDLNRMMNETIATGKDFHHEAQGELYRTEIWLGQRKETPLNGPVSSVAAQYSLTDALEFKRKLSDGLAQILDYNRANPDGKYRWPVSDQVPKSVRGLPIDSASINLIVQHRFPSYNPAKAVEIAETRRLKLDAMLGEHATDPAWANVSTFASDVNSLATRIRDDSGSPTDLASDSKALRDYALKVGKSSQDFRKAYDLAFAHVLGPINWSA